MIRYEKKTSKEFMDEYLYKDGFQRLKWSDEFSFLRSSSNQDVDRSTYYLAIEASLLRKKVVGIVATQINPRDENMIWTMYVEVLPEFNNRGIASKLLEMVAEDVIVHQGKRLKMSSYTTEGETYLKNNIIKRLVGKFGEKVILPENRIPSMRNLIDRVSKLSEASRGHDGEYGTSKEFYEKKPEIKWNRLENGIEFRIVGEIFQFYENGSYLDGVPEKTISGIIKVWNASSETRGMTNLMTKILEMGIALSSANSSSSAARKFYFRFLKTCNAIVVRMKGDEIDDHTRLARDISQEDFEKLYDDAEHDIRFVWWHGNPNSLPDNTAIKALETRYRK